MTELSNTKDHARYQFSSRLNLLLDHYQVPGKHAGRQLALAKEIGVSQEAARKWLEGQSIPTAEKINKISERYPCSKSWLRHGEGNMLSDSFLDQIISMAAKLDSKGREMAIADLELLLLRQAQKANSKS